MALEPGLNSLLQWGIENAAGSQPPGTAPTQPLESRSINADALRSLMGGPSDADLMKQAMHIIRSSDPDVSHSAKMTAFDNFEQLVENIDNANNMEPLGLWSPLIDLLGSPDPDLRRMAAWCVGTAVQNNAKAQERFLAVNGVPVLCRVAVEDKEPAVRRKAVYALSSEVRNYQPGMNEMVRCLPKEFVGPDQVSCEDMEVIDAIMAKLRDRD